MDTTFDRRRHRSWLVLLAGVVVLIVAALVGTALVLKARIDPAALQRKLVASVERETGRHFEIDGPVTFHFLPRPEIAASNITLANIEGGRAPAMLRVRAAEADIAILPLLHREVRLSRVTLHAPQVTFERRPDGVWNWRFRPPPTPQALSAPAGAHPPGRTAQGGPRDLPWSVGLDHLRIEGGSLTVVDRLPEREGKPDRQASTELRDLYGDDVSGGQPAWRIRLLRHGLALTIDARTGPVAAITQGWPGSAWPLRLMVMQDTGTGTNPSLRLVGTLSGGAARAFDLDLHASVPDLDGLQPLVPEIRLPAIQAAAIASQFSGALGDGGGVAPSLSVRNLHAQSGAAALGRLHIAAASVDASAAAAPLAAHVSLRDLPTPLVVTARLGALDQVERFVLALNAARGAWPARLQAADRALSAPLAVQLSADAGKATASVDGQLGAGGSQLRLQGSIPDLQAVLPHMPHLTNATLAATLAGTPDGHLTLDGLAIRAVEGDLDGHATLAWNAADGAKPVVEAVLHADRLDADALRQDTVVDPHTGLLTPHAPTGSRGGPATVAPEPKSETGLAPASAPAPGPVSGPVSDPVSDPVSGPVSGSGAPQVPMPAVVAPADVSGPGRGLDRVLPFARLDRVNGRLSLQVGTLELDGATYQQLSLQAALADGRLRVDPFVVQSAQGPVSGRLSADAGSHTLGVQLHAPAIPASSLAPLFPGWSQSLRGVSGTLQVEADVQGSGDTPRAVLGALGGTLGLSSVDGAIPNAVLGSWAKQLGNDPGAAGGAPRGLAGLARGLGNGLARIETRGSTALRCFAVAAHVNGGVAVLDPIALDTSRLSATGHGTMELGTDALDLHLMSSVLLGGSGASTPVHLSGTPGAMSVTADAGLPGGRFGIVIGGAAPPDPCPPALAAARFGQAGPDAAARKTGGKAIDVLRGLGLVH